MPKITEKIKDSLVSGILEFLEDVGEIILRPNESPSQHIWRVYGYERKYKNRKRWEYNRALKQLENRGEIEIIRESSRVFVHLTQKGHLKTLFDKLKQSLPKRSSWDGKWRLMIWDIPETSRKQRDAIRWFVKTMGFYQLQKSVFITPFELPLNAVHYLKESGLIKFIRFLRVDEMDHNQPLKKHFSLK